jgi:hypothetical protein
VADRAAEKRKTGRAAGLGRKGFFPIFVSFCKKIQQI